MDNQTNESYVKTCGLCETICNEDEVPTHECLQGYSNFITDDNFYFYPVLDDGETIVRRSLIQGAETVASVPFHGDNLENIQSVNRNSNHTKEKLSSVEEEMLILEVQSREPLWNYKLPLFQRNSRITKALWEEVSKTLNGKLSAAGCKSKFKNLHDTYRRLVNAEKLPSGSASKSNMNKWKHYKSMEFLRDNCLQKSTISNITDEDNSSSINEDINIIDEDRSIINENNEDTSISGDDHRPRKRKRTESQNSYLERIADALSQPLPNVVLPSLPEEDHIDAFLKLFGHNLRKLPPEKQDEWMQRYLHESFEMLKENS